MDSNSELEKLMQLFQQQIAMPPDNFNPHSLDSCIAKMQKDIESILDFQRNLIPRVDALERFRWHLMGAVAGATLFFQAAWEWVKTHVK